MAPNVMFQQGEYENLFSAFDEEVSHSAKVN